MTTTTRLPPLVIQGMSVRDYAYQWINGGCTLHQWCSGARMIDEGVIKYVAGLYVDVRTRWHPGTDDVEDAEGLFTLLQYLCDNFGHPAEPYIPDEHL